MTPQQISQLKTKYEVPQNQPFKYVLAHLIWAISSRVLCDSKTLLCQSVCPSILPSIGLLIHLSVGRSVRPSVHPSVGPSVHWSIRLSIHPSICWSVRPSVHLSVHPSIRLLIHLSTNPSVRPSIIKIRHNPLLCHCIQLHPARTGHHHAGSLRRSLVEIFQLGRQTRAGHPRARHDSKLAKLSSVLAPPSSSVGQLNTSSLQYQRKRNKHTNGPMDQQTDGWVYKPFIYMQ